MNIVANYNGESVTIINVSVNGHVIYVTYIDSKGTLKVDKMFYDKEDKIIATSCVL